MCVVLAGGCTWRTISDMVKKITLNEVGEMLTHVVKYMATKEDIADLRKDLNSDIIHLQEQTNSIEQELKLGRYETRLGNLETKVFGSARR